MGGRGSGNRPKPTVLKKLHRSQEPFNENEPMPEGDLAEVDNVPPYFDSDMRDTWNYALEHAPPGMLKRIDRSVLEVWVVACCLHRKAVTSQFQQGATLLVRTPNTRQLVQSPYLPIINRQALIMLKAAEVLGFSPTARPRINAPFSGGEQLNGSSRHGSRSSGQHEESVDEYLDRAPDPTAIH